MITIGIVLYNEEKHMPLLLSNLKILQAHSSKISVIVVDNASTDKTASILETYQQKFSFELLRRRENNLGQARQNVVDAAVTDWVGFIDGDCGINEQWVQGVLKTVPTLSSSVAAFGGPWISAGGWSDHYQALFRSPMGHFSLPQLALNSSSCEVFHIPTANVIYRKKDVLQVGGFRADFAFVGEDLDLSCRLRTFGKQLLMFSNLPIEHHLPVSLRQWSRKIFTYGRGRVHVASQNKQFSDRILILPLVFLAVIGLSVFVGEWRIPVLYFASAFLVAAVFSQPSHWGRVWVLAVCTHFSYALGMVYGWTLQCLKIFDKNKTRVQHPGKVSVVARSADFEGVASASLQNRTANVFDEAF